MSKSRLPAPLEAVKGNGERAVSELTVVIMTLLDMELMHGATGTESPPTRYLRIGSGPLSGDTPLLPPSRPHPSSPAPLPLSPPAKDRGYKGTNALNWSRSAASMLRTSGSAAI